MKKILVIVTILLSSCNPNYDLAGMFSGSSIRADKRLEESLIYNENAGETHLIVPENYKVYVCADTHVDSTTRNWEKFVKLYKADSQCPFALHLGDMINAKGNFERFFNASKSKPEGYVSGKDTIFYVTGNHDLYFNQWEEVKKYIGTSTYWFDTNTAGGKLLDLYICLDSGEGTLGVEGLAWLRNILAEKSTKGYRHIIVFTHTHMFKKDHLQGHISNYSMEETYEIAAILRQYKVDMFWSGHKHCREVINYGDVTYITLDTMQDPVEKPFYMVAQMGDNIQYNFISIKN